MAGVADVAVVVFSFGVDDGFRGGKTVVGASGKKRTRRTDESGCDNRCHGYGKTFWVSLYG